MQAASAGTTNLPEWSTTLRNAAAATFAALPAPDRAKHLWRYSDPAQFTPSDPAVAPQAVAGGQASIVVPEEALRQGVLVESVLTGGAVKGFLGSLVPAEMGRMEALNLAHCSGGYFVRIPRGVTLTEPIRISCSVEGPAGSFSAVRNVIVLEEGASATLVEDSRGSHVASGGRHLNEVTEIFAAAESSLRYVPLQHLPRDVAAHRTMRARLDRGARMLTVIASFGCEAYKSDLGVHLVGEGAESTMVGVCFAGSRQRMDHHTLQDHRGAHTRSDIDFRVVLSGRARSAYTGLIRIEHDASYTEAFQENRNLLLSDASRAESIPELEIMTDEVRCKHGATVGPIDREQLFYLATRGLDPREATRMIVAGFLDAAVANLPGDLAEEIHAETADRLREI